MVAETKENMAQKMEYLKVKDDFFTGKSVDNLYEEIQKQRSEV